MNSFVIFVEVRNDRHGVRFEIENGIASGDYFQRFLWRTRSALYEKGRESITKSLPQVNAFYVGALIGHCEPGVGFYSSLVNVNVYDQPGVEAAKNVAGKLLELQKKACKELSGERKTSEESACLIDTDPERVFHLLRHLASNDSQIILASGDEAVDDRFSLERSP